ncbi:phosphopyruvate hydratase [Candidatus Woesearchaeota archaeon]|nr:phosphopyruvate hydratase [Candidatus Woesearchaeota archaeon]
MDFKIRKIKAREVLDSRGNPTIEADLITKSCCAKAIVPSGASTGIHEALELRDNDNKRYSGKGVLKAVNNVNKIIAKKLIGVDCRKQREIDDILIELDGTENKSKLGANAILAVSMAACKAGAICSHKQIYEYIQKLASSKKLMLPDPMLVVLEGGKHADNSTDFQEFLILPKGAKNFRESLRYGIEVYHCLERVLKSKGYNTNVGNEGAFAPNLNSNEEAVELIAKAIEKAGYSFKQVSIALDSASSEIYENGKYNLKKEKIKLTSDEMIDLYSNWVEKYPIISIEDGLAQDDWNGWQRLNRKLGDKIQIVGDDLLVTNIKRIKKAVELKAANSALIKLNQIGTVTETIMAIQFSKENKFNTILSQRAAETEDTFAADFAVGTSVKEFKFGPTRSERTAKYNRLLRIEEELGNKAKFARL